MAADLPGPPGLAAPVERRRAAFLDRDGVLNLKRSDVYYVLTPDQLELLPGAATGLNLLAQAGFRLIVVTNQRAVALGDLTLDGLDAIHAKLRSELDRSGVALDAIYVCPHDNDACNCRKPSPGLLLQALREFPDVDPARSVLFGDSSSDLEAAARAGIPAVQIPVNGSLEEAARAWLFGCGAV